MTLAESSKWLHETRRKAAVQLSILFRWTNFRSLSNSPATKSTILIPVIGYLLLFSDTVSQFFRLVPQLEQSGIHGGVPSRLLWVYFGLCFIAFANILYGFYCPVEIKHNASANAFIRDEGRTIEVRERDEICDRLERSDFGERFFLLKEQYYPADKTQNTIPGWHNYVLKMYFEMLDSRYRKIRITSAVLYIAGFFCLAIPSLQVFFRVLAVLFEALARAVF